MTTRNDNSLHSFGWLVKSHRNENTTTSNSRKRKKSRITTTATTATMTRRATSRKRFPTRKKKTSSSSSSNNNKFDSTSSHSFSSLVPSWWNRKKFYVAAHDGSFGNDDDQQPHDSSGYNGNNQKKNKKKWKMTRTSKSINTSKAGSSMDDKTAANSKTDENKDHKNKNNLGEEKDDHDDYKDHLFLGEITFNDSKDQTASWSMQEEEENDDDDDDDDDDDGEEEEEVSMDASLPYYGEVYAFEEEEKEKDGVEVFGRGGTMKEKDEGKERQRVHNNNNVCYILPTREHCQYQHEYHEQQDLDDDDGNNNKAEPGQPPKPCFFMRKIRAGADSSIQGSLESMDSLVESQWDPEEDASHATPVVANVSSQSRPTMDFFVEHVRFLRIQTQPRKVEVVYSTSNFTTTTTTCGSGSGSGGNGSGSGNDDGDATAATM